MLTTSHKSTQSCYICGAKPSEMNNSVINKQPNPEFYKYGLSSLHALIKMFECLLHIAYRLDIKKWAIRDKQDKELFQARKKDIQAKFKNDMGLIDDKRWLSIIYQTYVNTDSVIAKVETYESIVQNAQIL